ncbi:hypothetical protein GGC47_005427 [Bosea sp. OAE752]|uniref:hypothetical protein n=1 Tax=Bosea sp. OAE752 TaxID=2663873 RepID=UPI003D255B9E
MTQSAQRAPAIASAVALELLSKSAETIDRPIAEPKTVMMVEMAVAITARR